MAEHELRIRKHMIPEKISKISDVDSTIHIHIEPTQKLVSLNMKELWHFRELLFFLTWRDIKIRFKQTALGASWAILQPFLTMVVFSLFFGKLASMPSDGIPYPIFSYAALLPWNYFSTALTASSNSVVTNSNLITKVYFPRLYVPFSNVLSGVVDFGIAFLVLLGMMVFYNIIPTLSTFLLPLFLLLALTTALGASLWLSALNVKYRDVRYIIPFIVQFWMFATPVVYPSSLLDEPWRTLYGINPMVGVIEGFRWALLGTKAPEPMILLSALVSILLCVSGIYYFRNMEKTFADII
jgi:lipopolysaccharide transport system permease protein